MRWNPIWFSRASTLSLQKLTSTEWQKMIVSSSTSRAGLYMTGWTFYADA